MEITIEYNSCWRNSFLDKSNNEKVDKKNKRKYIASCQSLGKPENFMNREVTIDTVMGVLNRIIGDPRKLWQSREDEQYYFKDIESSVTFIDNIKCQSNEIVYLRNFMGNYNPSGMSGCYKSSSPIFTSDFSGELWGIFAMDFDELLNYIVTGNDARKVQNMNPFALFDRFNELSAIKAKQYDCKTPFEIIKNKYAEWDGNTFEKTPTISYYCAALYLKFEELEKKGYNVASILSKNGCFPGFSKRNITKSDFNGNISTGGKQLIIGNPYYVKNKGKEVEKMLTKADGTLIINIEIDEDKSLELKKMIDDASVSGFRLGKKGLAYVSNVRV